MKYTDTQITFSEFPNEIALCINISNCSFHCSGCHSPELWEDVGTILNQNSLARLIDKNKGITCVGFMGGKPEIINTLAAFIKHGLPYNLKVGWYWGGNSVPKEINLRDFDYIKLGPYIEKLGGLDNPNTNQRMYKIIHEISDRVMTSTTVDITYKFWKHGNK